MQPRIREINDLIPAHQNKAGLFMKSQMYNEFDIFMKTK